MDDVADQIRAWADAAAPPDDNAVQASDIVDGHGLPLLSDRHRTPSRHRRHQLVAAAAVLVVIAAISVALATSGRDDPQQVTVDQPVDGARPEVTFELLSMEQALNDDMGTLRSASTRDGLTALWSEAGLATPVPSIDFDKQVVVSITIPDDACPPTLEGFDREGSTLEPRFVEPSVGCNEPLIPKTYIAALDWATTGSSFRLFLPGQPLYDFGDTYLDVDQADSPPVSVRLELSSHTMAAGSTITGRVVVNNNSGRALDGTTCVDFFAVELESPTVKQDTAWPACIEGFSIPIGESTYEVTVWGTYLFCATSERNGGPAPTSTTTRPGSEPFPPDAPPCTADGKLPPLPPGEYKATLDQAMHLVPTPDPITVTIT